jgi:hypothetical protein
MANSDEQEFDARADLPGDDRYAPMAHGKKVESWLDAFNAHWQARPIPASVLFGWAALILNSDKPEFMSGERRMVHFPHSDCFPRLYHRRPPRWEARDFAAEFASHLLQSLRQGQIGAHGCPIEDDLRPGRSRQIAADEWANIAFVPSADWPGDDLTAFALVDEAMMRGETVSARGDLTWADPNKPVFRDICFHASDAVALIKPRPLAVKRRRGRPNDSPINDLLVRAILALLACGKLIGTRGQMITACQQWCQEEGLGKRTFSFSTFDRAKKKALRHQQAALS